MSEACRCLRQAVSNVTASSNALWCCRLWAISSAVRMRRLAEAEDDERRAGTGLGFGGAEGVLARGSAGE